MGDRSTFARAEVAELMATIMAVLDVPIPAYSSDHAAAALLLRTRAYYLRGTITGLSQDSHTTVGAATAAARTALEKFPVSYKPYDAEAVTAVDG